MSEHVKEILVPIDGSENSIRAARFGLEMADAMSVPLRLFYVFPAASVEIIGMAGMSRADIDQAAQASAQRAFDSVRKELGRRRSKSTRKPRLAIRPKRSFAIPRMITAYWSSWAGAACRGCRLC
jgi:nucleotide-binding universal stress UspA family protein